MVVAHMKANEIIERQLDEYLVEVEQAFDCDALAIVGDLLDGVDDLVRDMVEGLRQRDKLHSRLAVLLTTNGGYIQPVERIVGTFRHYYEYVCFIVPNYAFSAGTILAMSGDDIFMDYYSRLGPIDPQVRNRNGRSVPALGYLEQWKRLLRKADDGALNVAELQLMLEFDLAELYEYEHARELSIALLTEWLVAYKFKNWKATQDRGLLVTHEMRQNRAESIASELNNTGKWHTHSRGISMDVLRNDDKLKLQIEDLERDATRYEIVKRYDDLFSDYLLKRGYQGMLHTALAYQPFVT